MEILERLRGEISLECSGMVGNSQSCPGLENTEVPQNTEAGPFPLISDLLTFYSIRIPSILLEIPQGKFHVHPLVITRAESFGVVWIFLCLRSPLILHFLYFDKKFLRIDFREWCPALREAQDMSPGATKGDRWHLMSPGAPPGHREHRAAGA